MRKPPTGQAMAGFRHCDEARRLLGKAVDELQAARQAWIHAGDEASGPVPFEWFDHQDVIAKVKAESARITLCATTTDDDVPFCSSAPAEVSL